MEIAGHVAKFSEVAHTATLVQTRALVAIADSRLMILVDARSAKMDMHLSITFRNTVAMAVLERQIVHLVLAGFAQSAQVAMFWPTTRIMANTIVRRRARFRIATRRSMRVRALSANLDTSLIITMAYHITLRFIAGFVVKFSLIVRHVVRHLSNVFNALRIMSWTTKVIVNRRMAWFQIAASPVTAQGYVQNATPVTS